MKNILTFLAFLFAFSPLYAQQYPLLPENTVCTAVCLDSTGKVRGRMPNQNGITLNLHLPCDGDSTQVAEHNPTWWFFRPTTNYITFSVSTNNCIPGDCGLGMQFTLWEGDDCNNIHGVTCVTGTSGAISAVVDPCKIYYLQLDGLCESQCNVVLTYDKTSIMNPRAVPVIDINTKACLGSEVKLSASIQGNPCQTNAYSWITYPQGMAQITPSTKELNAANLVVNTIPPSGKITVCTKPIEFGICPVAAVEKCFNLEVVSNNLKPATCDVKLCPEEQPFDFDLLSCIKTTNPILNANVNPKFFNIKLPEGTTKQEKVTYAVEGTNCKGEVNLNLTIQKTPKIQLEPALLCDNETVIIKGSQFTQDDASPIIHSISKLANPKPQFCDSIFEVLIQAIKVEPTISGVATLDCSKKEITLDAGGVQTITYPNDVNYSYYKGVGKRAYQWYKDGNLLQGETQPLLKVVAKGKYSVNLTFTYEIMMTNNGKLEKWSKSCSKSAEVEIKEDKGNAVAETPILANFTCANDNNSFFISPDPNAQQYSWTVTNATVTNQNTNPKGIVSVTVTNSGNPYTVCLSKKVCNLVSVPNCITVSPVPNLNKPSVDGQTSVCLGDTVTYHISNLTSYKSATTFKWQITSGTIIGSDSDPSLKVAWNNSINNGSVKLVVTDNCSTKDSLLDIVINHLPPAKPTQIIGKKTVCLGDIEKYEVFQAKLSNTYNWRISNAQNFKPSNNSKSIEVVWNQIGKYKICVNAANKCFAQPSDEYCIIVDVISKLKPYAGKDDSTCAKSIKLGGKASQTGTNRKWSKVKGPGDVSFWSEGSESATAYVFECGEYIFEFKEWLGDCVVSDSVTILFKGAPELTTVHKYCNFQTNTYDIKFELDDCHKPLTIVSSKYPISFNPQTEIYAVKNVPKTDTIWGFKVKNSKGCIQEESFYIDCNCSTYAGTMKIDSTISVCSDRKIKAKHNGDQINDGNDTFAFILHEGEEEIIINEIDRNQTGEFSFIPSKMQCGKKYYISYMMGDDFGGIISPFDNCTQATLKGQPVIWNCQPIISVGNDLTVCGLEANLQASQLKTGESGIWKGAFSSISDPKAIMPKVTVNNSGIYKFWWVVQNNTCKDSVSLNVTFLNAPNITVSSNSPICEGDSLLLNSSGAKHYTWKGPNNFINNSQNPIIPNCNIIASGKYFVEGVNSNGCKNTLEVNVEVKAKPTLDITTNSPICEEETLQLNATGANTYIWTGPNNFSNNNQSPIIASSSLATSGKYKVEGKASNGCKNSAEIVVEIKAKPILVITSNSPICEGDDLLLLANGANTYSWAGPNNFNNNNQNPIIASSNLATSGKYKVEGTASNGCKNSAEIVVEIKVKPNALITSNSPVCEGKTAMLEASGGTSYKWSGPDNFNSTLSNPTIPNVQAKNAGLYSVEVTNADNCKGTATTNLVVENCISSKDITNKNVQIYPNPFTQQLNIDADEIMDKIIIYNALGQIILEQNCQNNKTSLDVSNLPSAQYNLKINWANGKKSEYKVMKQ